MIEPTGKWTPGLIMQAAVREGECMVWTRCRNSHGYGKVTAKTAPRRKTWIVPRLLWTLLYGPIPEGVCVLHRCDNPPCINPAHLFLGTRSDNTQDALLKGRLKPKVNQAKRRATLAAMPMMPWAKYSEKDIAEMRYLYAHSIATTLIGHLYGVDRSYVQDIVSGKYNRNARPLTTDEAANLWRAVIWRMDSERLWRQPAHWSLKKRLSSEHYHRVQKRAAADKDKLQMLIVQERLNQVVNP